MLPAALMAPTERTQVREHGRRFLASFPAGLRLLKLLRCFQHLLLRAHTAPPAAPRVFATATRTPYMVFFEAVELAHHEVSRPKTAAT